MNHTTHKNIKILIVEDEAVTAIYLKNKLAPLGYKVLRPVAKGEEAVIIAEKDRPNFILMDIRLAHKMDGIEASEHIFKTYQPNLIFMTAYNDKELVDRANQIPHAGYLIKPVGIHEINHIIEKVMEQPSSQ